MVKTDVKVSVIVTCLPKSTWIPVNQSIIQSIHNSKERLKYPTTPMSNHVLSNHLWLLDNKYTTRTLSGDCYYYFKCYYYKQNFKNSNFLYFYVQCHIICCKLQGYFVYCTLDISYFLIKIHFCMSFVYVVLIENFCSNNQLFVH